MNAKEARKIANEKNAKMFMTINDMVEATLKDIEKAAKNGEYFTRTLMDYCPKWSERREYKKRMRAMGYRVWLDCDDAFCIAHVRW